MAKGTGGQFERHIATELSLWWTNGADDYVFWRSQGSGGRATRRGKGGRSTSGQYGDICAVKPIGEPLIDFFCLELKKGYSQHSIQDVLDRPLTEKHVQQNHEKWFSQTIRAWKKSGAFSWMIFQQRKKRSAIVYMPWSLVQLLKKHGCWDGTLDPFATFTFTRRRERNRKEQNFKVSITNLREFLRCVPPKLIRKLAKEM
jgi:hypothetical protein